MEKDLYGEIREIRDIVDRLEHAIESLGRTLKGSREEGAAGLIARQSSIETRQRILEKEVVEVRNEWRTFRRVVMVWALVALFAGSAAGGLLGTVVGI